MQGLDVHAGVGYHAITAGTPGITQPAHGEPNFERLPHATALFGAPFGVPPPGMMFGAGGGLFGGAAPPPTAKESSKTKYTSHQPMTQNGVEAVKSKFWFTVQYDEHRDALYPLRKESEDEIRPKRIPLRGLPIEKTVAQKLLHEAEDMPDFLRKCRTWMEKCYG